MKSLADIGDCPLDRKTPFGIEGVSQTQFSIARHYGGITYNGASYVYNPVTDELIRADVLKWMADQDKEAKREAKPAGEQMELK
jgi:hypothetical protein